MSFMKWRDDQLELTDPRAMRALAHPVRLAILTELGEGPKTATQCAEAVGESPSSCSYHLRTLARWGLVEGAPSANGRERPWRKRKGGLRWSGRGEASRVLTETFLARDLELLQKYAERRHELEPEWQEPFYAQADLLVTAAELEEIEERLFDLLEPYFPRSRKQAPPEGARRVSFAAFGVPKLR